MKLKKLLFSALIVINALSLFGYATFVRNPELLVRFPWAPPIFAVSYPLFSRAQMILAFVLMAWALFERTRFRAWPLLLATILISGLAEFGGTSAGIPFGKYEYTDLLGPKFLDKVPYLIPLSWFFMAVPSHALADRIQAGWNSSWMRILLGSLILLSWDLTLDPAMSTLAPFWVWAEQGPYYGMPLLNLFGWFVTGVLIMGAFEVLKGPALFRQLPLSFHLGFYVVNLALPLGMVLIAGFWGAVLLTALIGAILFVAAWALGGKTVVGSGVPAETP